MILHFNKNPFQIFPNSFFFPHLNPVPVIVICVVFSIILFEIELADFRASLYEIFVQYYVQRRYVLKSCVYYCVAPKVESFMKCHMKIPFNSIFIILSILKTWIYLITVWQLHCTRAIRLCIILIPMLNNGKKRKNSQKRMFEKSIHLERILYFFHIH